MSEPTFVTNFNQFCTHCQLTISPTVQHYLQLCTQYTHQLEELEEAFLAAEDVVDAGRAREEQLLTAQREAINALGIFSESTLDEQSQEDYKRILWEELQRKPEELNLALLNGIVLNVSEASEPRTEERTIDPNETALNDSIDQPFIDHHEPNSFTFPVPTSFDSLWHQLEWTYVYDSDDQRTTQTVGFSRREFQKIKRAWTHALTLSHQHRSSSSFSSTSSTSSHPSQTNAEKTNSTPRRTQRTKGTKGTGLSKSQQAELLYCQLSVMAERQAATCNLETYFLDVLRIKGVKNCDIHAIDQFLQSNPEESFDEQQFVDAFYDIQRYGSDQTKKRI